MIFTSEQIDQFEFNSSFIIHYKQIDSYEFNTHISPFIGNDMWKLVASVIKDLPWNACMYPTLDQTRYRVL